MYKKLLLIAISLVSLAWQPTHQYLMASGMSMSSEFHSLATMTPFLVILLFLSK